MTTRVCCWPVSDCVAAASYPPPCCHLSLRGHCRRWWRRPARVLGACLRLRRRRPFSCCSSTFSSPLPSPPHVFLAFAIYASSLALYRRLHLSFAIVFLAFAIYTSSLALYRCLHLSDILSGSAKSMSGRDDAPPPEAESSNDGSSESEYPTSVEDSPEQMALSSGPQEVGNPASKVAGAPPLAPCTSRSSSTSVGLAIAGATFYMTFGAPERCWCRPTVLIMPECRARTQNSPDFSMFQATLSSFSKLHYVKSMQEFIELIYGCLLRGRYQQRLFSLTRNSLIQLSSSPHS